MPQCITRDVLLAPYTTLRIGGKAEHLAEVTDVKELLETVEWAKSSGHRITVLGGGSNVLVDDDGIRGVVLHMRMTGLEYDETGEEVTVRAGAGEKWDSLVHETAVKGYWGLENLSGIPGHVGAAPVQNINAYGVSVGDSVIEVIAYDRETGERRSFDREECRFGYRDSFFKSEEGSRYIISEVSFMLRRRPDSHIEYRSSSQSIERKLREAGIIDPKPLDVRNAVITVRKNIGMLEGMFRSAGSFFKNTIVPRAQFDAMLKVVERNHAERAERFAPWHWELPDGTVKVSTAFLMECTPYNKTDYKGRLFNDAVGISPLHTLSLVNANDAHAADVRAFVECITDAVEKEFGVRIETEVCYMS